jgi:hypothetical protein
MPPHGTPITTPPTNTASTPLEQLASAQHKADTIQQVTEALKDSTKVLADETIRDLLHFAQKTSYASDATMPFRVSSQHHENGRLNKSVVTIWNRQLALQQELDQIRKYHGFDTAQALKEAVEAGKTKPLPAPVKPAVRVTTSNRDKIIADAIARKEAFDLKNNQVPKNPNKGEQ